MPIPMLRHGCATCRRAESMRCSIIWGPAASGWVLRCSSRAAFWWSCIAADLNKRTALAPRFLKLLATLALWTALPNGKRALFYDFWEGMLVSPTGAKGRRRADMAKVLAQLASGAIRL